MAKMDVKPVPVDRPVPIERVMSPLNEFLRKEASGGVLLLACTVIALAWANSPWGESYEALWHTYATIGVGEWALSESLLHWVNDGLMAIFFFVVGLEIKRELLVGELASPKKALLPIMAAIGGMALPAGLYAILNAGGDGSAGWGIPMATDIAFAVGVMALLGKRVPTGLKVFLTALAIVDDLGAVLVIAIFYSGELNWLAMGVAAGVVGLLVVANLAGVRRPLAYALLGVVLWVAVLESGVHATIAGVLLAMTIPASVRLNEKGYAEFTRQAVEDFARSDPTPGPVVKDAYRQAALHRIGIASAHAEPVLLRLEHALVGWVAFFIMPIFALANAGVHLGGGILEALVHPVTLGIVLGLVVGKQVGVFALTWLAVKLFNAPLMGGVTWRHIYGASCLAGIGFTMSLFIAGLAFAEDPENLHHAKVGIMAASLISAVIGLVVLGTGGRAAGAEAREGAGEGMEARDPRA